MKKMIYVLVFLLVINPIVYAQEVIENANNEPVPSDGITELRIPDEVLLEEGKRAIIVNESGTPKPIPVNSLELFYFSGKWKVPLIILSILIGIVLIMLFVKRSKKKVPRRKHKKRK